MILKPCLLIMSHLCEFSLQWAWKVRKRKRSSHAKHWKFRTTGSLSKSPVEEGADSGTNLHRLYAAVQLLCSCAVWTHSCIFIYLQLATFVNTDLINPWRGKINPVQLPHKIPWKLRKRKLRHFSCAADEYFKSHRSKPSQNH